MSSAALMSVAEYALHRACSDSYVRRLRRQGRLVLQDGQIDVAASDAVLDATTDPTRGGDRTAPAPAESGHDGDQPPPIGAGVISLREAMRRERLAKAKTAELELGERSGELTRVRDVDRDVFTLARQAMQRMLTMGGKLRQALAAETDPAACQKLIDDEVRQIADDMQKAARDMLNTRLAGAVPPSPPASTPANQVAADA